MKKRAFTLIETLTVMALISILIGFAIKNESKSADTARKLVPNELINDCKDATLKIMAAGAEEGQEYKIIDFDTTKNNNQIKVIDHCKNGEEGFQIIVKFDCSTLDNEEDIKTCKNNNLNYAYYDYCSGEMTKPIMKTEDFDYETDN